MRITIAGAGAMGTLFAARLALAGETVRLIEADASTIETIRAHGVRLTDHSGTYRVMVPISLASESDSMADLLIFFTKGAQTCLAARSCAHLAGPHTLVLTLQNGLGNAEQLASFYDPAQVLLGITNFPSDRVSPGEVLSHGVGEIHLGRLQGGSNNELEDLGRTFSRSGLECHVETDIQVRVWEKVAFNTALNSVCALAGVNVATVAKDPRAMNLVMMVAQEVTTTARACGVQVDFSRVQAAILQAVRHQGMHRPSMLQDIDAGRPTEVDFLSGAVLSRARTVGVGMPATYALDALLRVKPASPQGTLPDPDSGSVER
jgi:2-dehydropantoate 2-reductase